MARLVGDRSGSDSAAMALPLVLLIVSFDVLSGCQTPPWVLKRADPGSSGISFLNNTVSDAYSMVRWAWRDSSGGFWDTRIRVSLSKEEIIGGGFTYSDQYENELASVRWYKTTIDGPIRWKYNSIASPPDSWWMTSVVPHGNMTWGFKNQITDGSWVFKVGNDTLEPKSVQNVDGWSQQGGMHVGHKWKRSLRLQKDYETNLQMEEESSVNLNPTPSTDYLLDEEGDIIQTIIEYFKSILPIDKIKDMLSSIGI